MGWNRKFRKLTKGIAKIDQTISKNKFLKMGLKSALNFIPGGDVIRDVYKGAKKMADAAGYTPNQKAQIQIAAAPMDTLGSDSVPDDYVEEN